MNLTVLIADDEPPSSVQLQKFLAKQETISEIFLATDAVQAFSCLRNNPIDLIMMDMDIQVMQGINCVREILKEFPGVKIIVLSNYDDLYHINEMYKAGAMAYLFKTCMPEEIIEAIGAVMKGETWFSKDVLKFIVTDSNDNIKHFYIDNLGNPFKINQREVEILKFISEGLTDREIAGRVFLSLETVKGYRKDLLKKTGSRNKADLTLFAVVNNIIPL